MASMWLSNLKLPLSLIVIQATFFVLFGFFVDYDSDARPGVKEARGKNTSAVSSKAGHMLPNYYPSKYNLAS